MGCGVGLPSVRDRAARGTEDGERGFAGGSTREMEDLLEFERGYMAMI